MWSPSQIDGPIPVPTYGSPEAVGPYNIMLAPVTGHDARYHLNLPAELVTEDLAAFQVFPAAPVRVIAGCDTAFLRFDDEAAARAALPDDWIDA